LPLAEKAVRLASGPEALRDLKATMPLREKGMRVVSAIPRYRFTLGVAYYRAGRYREAVEVLRPNLPRRKDRDLAFDLYLLAMSHHRLGETARARDYFDWATRWAKVPRDLDAVEGAELTAFRAEAEELLGSNPKKD
jgi:tetratricopeptide (TPR) repeat protein